jgi:hypothetical protein
MKSRHDWSYFFFCQRESRCLHLFNDFSCLNSILEMEWCWRFSWREKSFFLIEYNHHINVKVRISLQFSRLNQDKNEAVESLWCLYQMKFKRQTKSSLLLKVLALCPGTLGYYQQRHSFGMFSCNQKNIDEIRISLTWAGYNSRIWKFRAWKHFFGPTSAAFFTRSAIKCWSDENKE